MDFHIKVRHPFNWPVADLSEAYPSNPRSSVRACPSSAARPSRRERRVTLAPPMCLHLRHSFEGIILGFASGRKRLWRSTIRLRAITDRPEVLAWSPRVRLDPERERRSLIGHDWQYGAWQFSAKSTATRTVTSSRPRPSSASLPGRRRSRTLATRAPIEHFSKQQLGLTHSQAFADQMTIDLKPKQAAGIT
jgi:hypothetical protein